MNNALLMRRILDIICDDVSVKPCLSHVCIREAKLDRALLTTKKVLSEFYNYLNFFSPTHTS